MKVWLFVTNILAIVCFPIVGFVMLVKESVRGLRGMYDDMSDTSLWREFWREIRK